MREGKDSQGHYAQWGNQKKYYFNPDSARSRQNALEKAHAQERAAYANGYRGSGDSTSPKRSASSPRKTASKSPQRSTSPRRSSTIHRPRDRLGRFVKMH